MSETGKRLLLAILNLVFRNFYVVVRCEGDDLVIEFRSRHVADHLVMFDAETGKEINSMETIASGKKRVLAFKEATKNGTILPDMEVVGEPVWSVTPADSIQLLPAPGGLTCDAANIAGVAVDDFVVKCEAEVKLESGATKLLTGTVHLTALADTNPDHLVLGVGPEVDL
jgi:hypothetical protein